MFFFFFFFYPLYYPTFLRLSSTVCSLMCPSLVCLILCITYIISSTCVSYLKSHTMFVEQLFYFIVKRGIISLSLEIKDFPVYSGSGDPTLLDFELCVTWFTWLSVKPTENLKVNITTLTSNISPNLQSGLQRLGKSLCLHNKCRTTCVFPWLNL